MTLMFYISQSIHMYIIPSKVIYLFNIFKQIQYYSDPQYHIAFRKHIHRQHSSILYTYGMLYICMMMMMKNIFSSIFLHIIYTIYTLWFYIQSLISFIYMQYIQSVLEIYYTYIDNKKHGIIMYAKIICIIRVMSAVLLYSYVVIVVVVTLSIVLDIEKSQFQNFISIDLSINILKKKRIKHFS